VTITNADIHQWRTSERREQNTKFKSEISRGLTLIACSLFLAGLVFSAKFFPNSSFAPDFLYQKAVKRGTILLAVLSQLLEHTTKRNFRE